MKVIAILGGGSSEIGKTYIGACIAYFLNEIGVDVQVLKFDGYLNRDTGKMCEYHTPQQFKAFAEEVFVLADGTETDSDLGVYERFLNKDLNRKNYLTNGELLFKLISEDKGNGYILTFNDLKELYLKHIESFDCEVLLIEVGGTIGDSENRFFLEVLSELANLHKTLFILVAPLFPLHLSGANVLPSSYTKLIRSAIALLSQIGIRPDSIIMRLKYSDSSLILKAKTYLEKTFQTSTFSVPFAENVYLLPSILQHIRFYTWLTRKLEISHSVSRIPSFRISKVGKKIINLQQSQRRIKICIIDRMESYGSYVSLIDAILCTATKLGINASLSYKNIKNQDGIILLNDYQNLREKFKLLKKARERKIPTLATGGGFYFLVDEFLKRECKKRGITKHGKMKVGTQPTKIQKKTRLFSIYRTSIINRRHRHSEYIDEWEELMSTALIPSGYSIEGTLEAVELEDHPFYIGVAFNPEYTSRPLKPEPIFLSFLNEMKNYIK